jgi:hypothetical protein
MLVPLGLKVVVRVMAEESVNLPRLKVVLLH